MSSITPSPSSSTAPSHRRDADIPHGVSSILNGSTGVRTIILHRPHVRNCVDGPTARALYEAFVEGEKDDRTKVFVLYGAGGTFSAGADLTAVSEMKEEEMSNNEGTTTSRANPLLPFKATSPSIDNAAGITSLSSSSTRLPFVAHTADLGPMGVTRLVLTKPTIGAIAGYAVAGGLELACWCDIRIGEASSVTGVFCRRFGVPLIDGGTIRLARLIGESRAMEMILTGRAVEAKEAKSIGLYAQIVPDGTVRAAAETLAAQIASFPQLCMRTDRWSTMHYAYEQSVIEGMKKEFQNGVPIVREESIKGAKHFVQGQGRHGQFQQQQPYQQQPLSHPLRPLTASSSSMSSSNSSSASLPPPSRFQAYVAVLFDLGGVIVDSPVPVIQSYEAALGVPKNSINLMLARSKHFHALERGEIAMEEFAQLFEEEAKLAFQRHSHSNGPQSHHPSLDARHLFTLMSAVRPRPSMIELVRYLRNECHLIVGVITNNWKTTQSDARGSMVSTLDGEFDFIIESCVVGRRKPDRAIWECAMQQVDKIARQRQQHNESTENEKNVSHASSSSVSTPSAPSISPSQCIFLDDLGSNLKSAESFGLKTIKVDHHYDRSIEEVKKLIQLAPHSSNLASKL